MNELPTRKIFADIDDPSGGPSVYFGHFGVKLQTCQKLNVARFPPWIIDAEFHSDLISNNDPSNDQMYLRDMILAISSVTVSGSLDRRSPGQLRYASWLTTGNRILRIYISFEIPLTSLSCVDILLIFILEIGLLLRKNHIFMIPKSIYLIWYEMLIISMSPILQIGNIMLSAQIHIHCTVIIWFVLRWRISDLM